MSTDRDYFDGCHNRPLFDTVAVAVVLPAVDAPTLADVVRAIDARRVVAQLELPAEFLPVPDGALFG